MAENGKKLQESPYSTSTLIDVSCNESQLITMADIRCSINTFGKVFSIMNFITYSKQHIFTHSLQKKFL